MDLRILDSKSEKPAKKRITVPFERICYLKEVNSDLWGGVFKVKVPLTFCFPNANDLLKYGTTI